MPPDAPHSPNRPFLKALRAGVRLPALAWRAVRWRQLRGGWFPRHLLHHRPFDPGRLPPGVPLDVMVLVADHFEPPSRFGEAIGARVVRSWCDAYREIALRHRDADGRLPQHTWFYRAEYRNRGCLEALSEAAFAGLGEIEFHLHHGYASHQSFAAQLQDGLKWFNRAGAMLTAEALPRQRFGYVAGNWSLDNGAGDDALSGCNTELLALRQAGCFADFTFPALGSLAQPRKTNAIYYATDGPEPKSYDDGKDVAVGVVPSGDLLIFQGPSVVDWQRGRLEDGALEDFAPPAADRLRAWLRANVHVRGRPEWLFVKLHSHAVQSQVAFLGAGLEEMFAAMEEHWNRPPFQLHYVTAREAYNIVRAAESGRTGDPDDYRDFEVPPPANRKVRCRGADWLLHCHTPQQVCLKVFGSEAVHIELAEGPLRSISGKVRRLDARFADNRVCGLEVDGEGPFNAELAAGAVWACAVPELGCGGGVANVAG
jgi:hypothetical protein